MPDLSIENIERISRDVRRQEITFSHLFEELIDHICCDVESEMLNGLTFSEAYRKVKQKMEPRRLKEIQEETLYAVDTKYRYMKNTMKFSGVAGAVLFGFGALFKIQHWAFASMMMTLGALILVFVFLPSALGVLWKETHNRNKLVLFISAFFTGGFFIFGILFKVQHWQGAAIVLILAVIFGILFFIPSLIINLFRDQENKNKRPVYLLGAAGSIFYVAGLFLKIQQWPRASICMILGLIILGVIVLPWYTWLTWKDEKYVSSRFLFLIIGSLAIIIPGALVNLNMQHSYEDGFFPHLEQQQVMYNFLYRNNNALVTKYKDSISYPRIEQLHSRTTGLLSLINDVQVRMVRESEGEPGTPSEAGNQIKQSGSGPEILYRSLSRPFHTSPVKDFLIPGSASRLELNKALTDYVIFISELIPDKKLQESINLVQALSLLPGESPDNGPVSLISGLHSLELMKNSLLTIESNVVMAVAKH